MNVYTGYESAAHLQDPYPRRGPVGEQDGLLQGGQGGDGSGAGPGIIAGQGPVREQDGLLQGGQRGDWSGAGPGITAPNSSLWYIECYII